METSPFSVGSMAASNCIRSTRALVEEFSRVSNPRLVFMPRAIASSRDRFNGAETASPMGVLPLNCANNGRNVHNSVETALKTVNLCLIPNDFFDDCTRHWAVRDERRAVPMHPLEQGASPIIDECNVLKIH